MSGQWTELLELATSAALEAGNHLAARANSGQAVLADPGRDIKLAADRQAEALIVNRLRGSGYPILAEEGGEYEPHSADALRWVVDPLDGTMNFSREIPICCTAIALMKGIEPVLGVVHDFSREETFTGIAAGGAWRNGIPMQVSGITSPGRAILATGLPAYREYTADSLLPVVERFQSFRKVRMLGSAALMLAYVAAGRVDAYEEQDIMLWDIAAGMALVQGAGGHVSWTPSDRHRWGCRVRCAASASIWAEFDGQQDAAATRT